VFNKIGVTNFKSIRHLDLELKDINLIVGANASGKSNFIDIFDFIRQVVNSGLEKALENYGGIKNIVNYKVKDKKFSINLSIRPETKEIEHPFFKRIVASDFSINEISYNFTLKYLKNKQPDFKVVAEKLIYKMKIKGENDPQIIINRDNKGFVRFSYPVNKSTDTELIRSIIMEFFKNPKPNKLMVEGSGFVDFLPIIDDFKRIGVYDLYPKHVKEYNKITSEQKLRKDSGNLANIIMKINESHQNKILLQDKVRNILPFIKSISTKLISDKDISFSIKENYFSKRDIPSQLISYGSINILALIVALYFEKNKLTIIEEPERNLHPLLILSVCELLREVSSEYGNQIIISTHNIEIIKTLSNYNIIITKRNGEGDSEIKSTKDIEEIKDFLNNELGIEELFYQDFPMI
jgi:predicted ATPase